MELNLSESEKSFQGEVRSFLENDLPSDIREKVRTGRYVSRENLKTWTELLSKKGWSAPSWPKEFGGTGWSLFRRHLFDLECRKANAPPMIAQNVAMLGPALCKYGSDWQKERFLPPLLTADEIWCQGYSEPGSGSDLASLQCKAVSDGDDYIVTGRKIWTSIVEMSDWMFCLVRTDQECKPQKGITFLLVDLRSDGVEIRPTIALNGERLWSEIIFDEVRVPKAHRVGAENEGWTIAKSLLGDERVFVARIAESTRQLQRVKELAKSERADGAKLWEDKSFRLKMADLEVRLAALDMMLLRFLSEAEHGSDLGARPSALKALGSPLVQAMDSATVEAIGYYMMADHVGVEALGGNLSPIHPDHGEALTMNMLHHRGYSIAGGTTEIQKNILAKAVLGL